MQFLYVNNDWCLKTYSGKQYPLEETLSRYYAKTYISYSYDDIKDKTYDELEKDEFITLKNCVAKMTVIKNSKILNN